MMDIKPIHSRADQKEALQLISKLVDFDPEPSTPGGDMFEVMSTLIAAYEARHFPSGPADPIEAIKFRMDQQGLNVADLEPMIGRKKSRVSGACAQSTSDACGDPSLAQWLGYPGRESHPAHDSRRLTPAVRRTAGTGPCCAAGAVALHVQFKGGRVTLRNFGGA